MGGPLSKPPTHTGGPRIEPTRHMEVDVSQAKPSTQPGGFTSKTQTLTGGHKSNPPTNITGRMFNPPASNRLFHMGPKMILPVRDTPRTKFVPYYDILQNDCLYVIRCILPLMKEETAQELTIKVNLRHSKCKISGNYVPSTLIGKESNRQIKMRQPLLPIVCSDMTTTGYFELDISIPADIRDDMSKVKLIHDCWGFCISIPRRKITHGTQVA